MLTHQIVLLIREIRVMLFVAIDQARLEVVFCAFVLKSYHVVEIDTRDLDSFLEICRFDIFACHTSVRLYQQSETECVFNLISHVCSV